ESETDIGKIIVTEGTIALEGSGRHSKWDTSSWFPAWWTAFGAPHKPNTVLDKAKAFAEVAKKLVAMNVKYLNHPVITEWNEYNQQFIIFMRLLGYKMGDLRIRDAEDHLTAVGGTAAADGAKRLVKRKEQIARDRVNTLKEMVKPCHEEWWKLRKQLLNP